MDILLRLLAYDFVMLHEKDFIIQQWYASVFFARLPRLPRLFRLFRLKILAICRHAYGLLSNYAFVAASRAGMPTTVTPLGTSFVTTEFAPTFALSPIRMGPKIFAPEPITT